ncbi:TPM domain-containing protein [Neopusillimonas aestuarii]|uniref:TPM domain-containing protein n=1 Tax=Neopusillimonas aestuarii TaxID=2716226 RepID=UPI001D1983D6|nr:YgcG family protein [Pusillimonas sp. DMV24BSW_D]
MFVGPVFAQTNGEVPVPPLEARVTDTTDTLEAQTIESLTQSLTTLEAEKGAQIAVLIIPTTGTEGIDQYAVRAFEQWKLGRERVDDGILFVVAKDDRRMRIEVGYGLEGAVPDLLAGRIIREQVAPRFQQGDFAGGVTAGVNSLIGLVQGEDLPAPAEGVAEQNGQDDESWWDLALFGLIFVLAMPPVIAGVAGGVLIFMASSSLVFAVLGGMALFVISLAIRAARGGGGRGPGGGSGSGGTRRGRWGRAGAVGGLGGWAAGGSRGGSSGGFGGGGFGGGGGRSGGGGASGGW